ncbi:hypothetical protein HK104_007215 [Borealophlyctis nickersoniae]|nr:hypothetical protein HK104_007215 [Borealophlyctis nickersoniae]
MMAESSNTTDPQVAPEVDEEGYIHIVQDKLKKKILKEGTTPIQPKSTVEGILLPTHLSSFHKQRHRERDSTLDFTLGAGSVIQGWELGVATMKVGEQAEFIISPEYGYGPIGNEPTIPPNATLKFDVEVISADPDPIPQKIETAKKHKEDGNAFFKSGAWEDAAASYRLGLEELKLTWGADPPEVIEINALKVALNSNLAASCLKTKDCTPAVEACEAGLAIEPTNIKLLFRLGQAHCGLANFDKAIEALERASKLDENDQSIRNEIARVRKTEQLTKQREKKMYSQMFSS